MVEAEEAGGGGAVLRLVERVPPAELDEELDAVLAGDAAVGTRAPVAPHPPVIVAPVYCKIKVYITLYALCSLIL